MKKRTTLLCDIENNNNNTKKKNDGETARRSEGPKSSSSLAFGSDKKATKGKIDDDAIEKKAEGRGTLEALNNQFYAHVAEQKRKNPIKSWAKDAKTT